MASRFLIHTRAGHLITLIQQFTCEGSDFARGRCDRHQILLLNLFGHFRRNTVWQTDRQTGTHTHTLESITCRLINFGGSDTGLVDKMSANTRSNTHGTLLVFAWKHAWLWVMQRESYTETNHWYAHDSSWRIIFGYRIWRHPTSCKSNEQLCLVHSCWNRYLLIC